MDKVKELKIDSKLWTTPSKLVNLLDFKPNKLSVQQKVILKMISKFIP